MTWRKADTERLKDLYAQGLPYKVIAREMGKTVKSVQAKGESEGLRSRKPRTKESRRFRATFWLPDGLAAAIDAECRRTGLTIGRLARMAITDRIGGGA